MASLEIFSSMSLIRNYITMRKWWRHGWDFVQKAYGGFSVSPGFAMIDMKIFHVRLIYTHPILMRVFCLTFKIFGWFYFPDAIRHNLILYTPYLKYIWIS